jgi:hypothetical protein
MGDVVAVGMFVDPQAARTAAVVIAAAAHSARRRPEQR